MDNYIRFQKVTPSYRHLPCSVCGQPVGSGFYTAAPERLYYCPPCKLITAATRPRKPRATSAWMTNKPKAPRGMTVNQALRQPRVQTLFASGGRAIVRKLKP